MKTVLSTTAAAALVAFTLSASPVPTKSKTSFEGIVGTADSLSTITDRLAMDAIRPDHPDAQLAELEALRSKVNIMGRELAALEHSPTPLPEWERNALDRIVPSMNTIAAETDTAIRNFNANRNRLWATGFPEQTAQLYRQAEYVKTVAQNNLKLAAARHQEQRLDEKVNGSQPGE